MMSPEARNVLLGLFDEIEARNPLENVIDRLVAEGKPPPVDISTWMSMRRMFRVLARGDLQNNRCDTMWLHSCGFAPEEVEELRNAAAMLT